MKILRIRLRNWRGVNDQSVEFSPLGVTVISGPNEIGKSSLIEAIDMLFDQLDSSTKAAVKAVKPVHKDEGAEVEAEIEVGAWRFIYGKKFHKRASTELKILAPRPENLTGREAHQRVQQILEHSLDVPLWRALRIAQGAGREMADLSGSRWLKSALDRAGGTGASGESEGESLFDAVVEERARWWTETGKPRRELAEALEAETTRKADVDALRDRLAALQIDLEAEERLAREIVRTAGDLEKARQRAMGHDRTLTEIGRLRSFHERARTGLAQAEAALEGAEASWARRAQLEHQHEQAAKEAGIAATELAQGLPERASAQAALRQAELGVLAAEQELADARLAAVLAEKDHEFLRTGLDFQLMQERRERIEKCDRELAAAEALLERNLVTPQALDRLNQLREQEVRAEAQLAAASTEVTLTAENACTPVLDGTPDRLAAGEIRTLRRAQPLVIELPGVLRIQIRSGEGVEGPREELATRARCLAEALREVGTKSLEAATLAHRERNVALERIRQFRELRAQDLRDLSFEGLLKKIERARILLEDYRNHRKTAAPLPGTLEDAKRRKALADETLAENEAAVANARAVLEERRKHADRIVHDSARAEEKTQILERRRASLQEDVAAEERERPREKLQIALREALAQRDAARRGESNAARELEALQPDLAEQLARKDQDLVVQLGKQKHDLELEWTGLRARLTSQADEGLAEKLGAAEAAYLAAAQDAASKRARSEAARLLHQVMQEERAAERARYVAPFQDKIESLGRIVFGPQCTIQINDRLEIESRTLEGRTVPFDSLSAGTREQLGVITRLACALLAANEGGVPVVLDDAFGWSDPDRLERVQALLGMAGRTCQVILLTCDPSRGQGIHGACIVRLGPA